MIVFFPWALTAQVGSLRVISGSVCSGVVETPILASQINGMAAMSIRLLFDSSAISYHGVRNVHPAIANAVISGANSRFVIAWFSLQPVNLPNDTLLVIRWLNNGGRSSSLLFDTQSAGGCEIANVQAQVMPVQYIGGQASITGAQAPVPLNPLRLSNLNQPSYLFVYSKPPCIQQSILQLSSDSLFQQITYSSTLTDTLYRLSFSGIFPALGDSLRWWRLGGIFNGDTAWSSTGRMAFALSLGSSEEALVKAKAYPNPFRQAFYLSHPEWKQNDVISIACFGADGRLLEKQAMMADNGSVFIEMKNTSYQGQMLIYWHDPQKSGIVIMSKTGY